MNVTHTSLQFNIHCCVGDSLSWIVSVTRTQARDSQEEGTKGLPPSDWPGVGEWGVVCYSLTTDKVQQNTFSGAIPGQMVLGSLRNQAKQSVGTSQ